MNHLIVYAHPSSDSFSNKILTVAKEFSVEKEYKTEVRDLYSIGFDPLLKNSDLKKINGGETPDEIKREQNYIQWADLITFIYPVWWTGMPAILKGYIDRVFSYGIAYKQGSEGVEGLLKEKAVFLFSPMGTSNEEYDKTGMLDSMKQTCDEGIFEFCGMKVIKHVFFGSASNLDSEMKNEYLKAIPLLMSKSLSSNNSKEENKENKDQNKNGEEKSNKEEHNKDNKENKNSKDNKESKESDKDKTDNNKSKSNDNSNNKSSGENSKLSK